MTRTVNEHTGREYATADASETSHAIWSLFPAGVRGWDIGANDGQSVDRMLEMGFTEVFALEPSRLAFDDLIRNWAHDLRVTLLPVAASDHDGTMQLSSRPFPMHASNQLVAMHMPDDRTRLDFWWDDRITETVTVPCVTLDSLAADYGTPDLVKVDVEGGEELVLQGAKDLIAQRETSWLVEFHSPKLLRAVLGLLDGYDLDWYRNPDDILDHDDPNLDVNGWVVAFP